MAEQKVAVITGASSGIGRSAAKALAAQGWRIIALGRNPQRSAEALAEIKAAANGAEVDMIVADLAVVSDAKRAADEIAAKTDRIDVLLNNAGGIARDQVMTTEGLEENFAGNHLGPFVLTNRLLPLLKRAAKDAPKGSVRIINTSSEASERRGPLNYEDLQNLGDYNVGVAYTTTKLLNVLHAKALAKRLSGDNVGAYSFHPGRVETNFTSNMRPENLEYMRQHNMTFIPQDEGADTAIWLATTNDQLNNGDYYYLRAPRTPNPIANDDSAVERVWAESEKIAAKLGA
jgi:NAD(P)-dependent dehydrogenase (short-subunit alcohol dehydrogenase family)